MMNQVIFRPKKYGTERDIFLPTEKQKDQRRFEEESGIPSYTYTVSELDYLSLKRGYPMFMFGTMKQSNPEEYDFINSFPGMNIFDRYEYYENTFSQLLLDELSYFYNMAKKEELNVFDMIKREGLWCNVDTIQNALKHETFNLVSTALSVYKLLKFVNTHTFYSKIIR